MSGAVKGSALSSIQTLDVLSIEVSWSDNIGVVTPGLSPILPFEPLKFSEVKN